MRAATLKLIHNNDNRIDQKTPVFLSSPVLVFWLLFILFVLCMKVSHSLFPLRQNHLGGIAAAAKKSSATTAAGSILIDATECHSSGSALKVQKPGHFFLSSAVCELQGSSTRPLAGTYLVQQQQQQLTSVYMKFGRRQASDSCV